MTKGDLLLKQFLRLANTNDMLLKMHSREILQGYGNSELNCIDCIGKTKRPNASAIAEQMNMTRGAISKVLRKLLSKDAVVSYQLPDNQKEIYYKLTPYGREIFRQHRTRHHYWEMRDQSFFNTLDEETMDTVLRFMNLYNGYLDLKLANQMDPNHEASFSEEAETGATDERTV